MCWCSLCHWAWQVSLAAKYQHRQHVLKILHSALRAPVLVATALIELGMKYEDAVDLIRKKRRGAINAKQLEFLSKYKRRKYFIKVKGDKLSQMKYC